MWRNLEKGTWTSWGPLKCGVRVVGTVVSTTRCLAVTIRSRWMCPHGTRCADPAPLVANKRRSGLGALLVVHGVCTGEGGPMGRVQAVSTRCARVHPSCSPTQENIHGTHTNSALTYRKTAAICPEPRPVAPPAPRQTKKGWGKNLLRPDSCAFSWPSVRNTMRTHCACACHMYLQDPHLFPHQYLPHCRHQLSCQILHPHPHPHSLHRHRHRHRPHRHPHLV